jgi:hypothetical protein
LCHFGTIVNFISVFIYRFAILPAPEFSKVSLGHEMPVIDPFASESLPDNDADKVQALNKMMHGGIFADCRDCFARFSNKMISPFYHHGCFHLLFSSAFWQISGR